jgi:hypothetical protein
MGKVITADDTLPFVKDILLHPNVPVNVVGGPYPGISDGQILRPGFVQFPQGFEAMMARISNGRYTWLTASAQTPMGLFAPMYAGSIDMLYMIGPQFFADDEIAWHALFHEGAHLLRLQHLPGHLYPSRGLEEACADTAAYAGMKAVGFDTPAQRSIDYKSVWLSREPYPWVGEANILDTARRAAVLANLYLETQNHAR